MSPENKNTHTFASEHIPIPQLRDAIKGLVITPDDAGYDKARAAFYGKFNRRPALIVKVADANDVSQVVSFARENGMELAIRSGGHSVAGHSTTEGGILLDLSDMKGLDIDIEQHTAWAEAGLTAGEYTVAVGAHGLATGFGDTGSVGIGGITLGGGIGYLVRKYGMTIDDLLAAEMVLADGQFVHVDSNTHPDLFWAIRGGGGNFGVVTRFQYRLHPLETIVGGMLIFLGTADLIASFISVAERAPDDLSAIANIMVAPPMPFLPEEYHGKLIVMAMMAYAGDTSKGEEVVAPFRALGPIVDMVKLMPYPEIYKFTEMEEGERPQQESARSFFLNTIDRDVAETVMTHLMASTAPVAVAQLRVLGGAMARVPIEATAFAHRHRRFMVASGAVYEDPTEVPKHEEWVNDFAAALRQGEGGVYVNFLGDEGAARVREAYPGATWDRLVSVKARYDPTNLFRLNQNITPTSNVG